MLETLLDKKKLKTLFASVNNPMQALQIKNNIESCIQALKTPSDDLLTLLKEEGFSFNDFNATAAEKNTSVKTKKTSTPRKAAKAPRKINIENRTFLIENDTPVKVLTGRAISSEAEKGSVVIKYIDMSETQQALAKDLI